MHTDNDSFMPLEVCTLSLGEKFKYFNISALRHSWPGRAEAFIARTVNPSNNRREIHLITDTGYLLLNISLLLKSSFESQKHHFCNPGDWHADPRFIDNNSEQELKLIYNTGSSMYPKPNQLVEVLINIPQRKVLSMKQLKIPNRSIIEKNIVSFDFEAKNLYLYTLNQLVIYEAQCHSNKAIKFHQNPFFLQSCSNSLFPLSTSSPRIGAPPKSFASNQWIGTYHVVSAGLGISKRYSIGFYLLFRHKNTFTIGFTSPFFDQNYFSTILPCTSLPVNKINPLAGCSIYNVDLKISSSSTITIYPTVSDTLNLMCTYDLKSVLDLPFLFP